MSVFSQLDLTLLEFNLKKIGVTAHLGAPQYQKHDYAPAILKNVMLAQSTPISCYTEAFVKIEVVCTE